MTASGGVGGTVASGQGVNEILIGLLLTAIGFGSILFRAPVICCGFAIFGPILFIVGVVKAIQAPSAAPVVYPPMYPVPPYVPPPPTVPTATPPPPLGAWNRKCSSCGSENRPDAKFCTSCGAPFTAP